MTDVGRAPDLSWLDLVADSIRPSDSPPVQIRPILARYDVDLKKEVLRWAPRGRRGEVRRSADGRYSIVLFRRTGRLARLNSSERFTLAHELGHILIDIRTQWRPLRRREFYSLEAACDRFARRLMIPAALLEGVEDWDSRGVLTRALELADGCDIPLAKAAARVADVAGRVVLFRATITKNKAGEKVARVRWVEGRGSVVGIAVHKYLQLDTPIGTVLQEADRHGRVGPVQLTDVGTWAVSMASVASDAGLLGSMILEPMQRHDTAVCR